MTTVRDHHPHHNLLHLRKFTIVRCTTTIIHINMSRIISISIILTTPNRHRFDHLIQTTACVIFMSPRPTQFHASYPLLHFLRRHPDFDLLNQYT
jgi:hypothetical protein